ncbi:MAG: hypothetical protein J7M39_09165 [Anaerolineae bacterium]|nr:hypothetical protein [Anaerolineae bacterium]
MTRLDAAPPGGSPKHAPTTAPRSGTHRANIWTRREGTVATVAISCSRSRYALGEVVVQTTYRSVAGTGGADDVDDSHRVYLGNPTGRVIEEIWELLFDETARAQQFHPSSISIRLTPKEFTTCWEIRLRTIAQITAWELKVVVKGTATDSMRGRD